MKQILKPQHYPRLDTITMVEKTLRHAKELLSIAELKRRLPRQVNHQTLHVILRYLQESGKIGVTPRGVVWTFVPGIEALLARGRTWKSS